MKNKTKIRNNFIMETYRDITRRKLLKTGFLILSLPLLFNAKQISASIDEMTFIKMKYLIKGLRDTQNVICIREADRLERINNNKYYLHLRNAGFNSYNAQLIANALSKPSIKAIFFNKVSVLEEISDGSNSLKSEFTKLSINLDSCFTVYK